MLVFVEELDIELLKSVRSFWSLFTSSYWCLSGSYYVRHYVIDIRYRLEIVQLQNPLYIEFSKINIFFQSVLQPVPETTRDIIIPISTSLYHSLPHWKFSRISTKITQVRLHNYIVSPAETSFCASTVQYTFTYIYLDQSWRINSHKCVARAYPPKCMRANRPTYTAPGRLRILSVELVFRLLSNYLGPLARASELHATQRPINLWREPLQRSILDTAVN